MDEKPKTAQEELLAKSQSPPAEPQPAVPGGYMPQPPTAAAPFQWAWLGVALSLVYAGASVIGGFVLANDHKHTVKVSNSLGFGSHIEHQSDNNYIALGFVTAGVWVMIAIVIALLIYIARDVRTAQETRTA